jgi:hypothetical protein
MLTLFAIILVGLFLGMRHATDPDHVVAVTTIVTRQRSVRNAALIGVFWGLGHTITIFVVGTAIILFSVVVPPRIGLGMEFSVSLMLILLGILNLTGIVRWINERFTPSCDIVGSEAIGEGGARACDEIVLPNTDSRPGWAGRARGEMGLFQILRPLVIGVVHGLAGSAAIALLVLTTIHNTWWALLYLLVFGIGTIAGMMLITTAIAVPIAYTGNRFTGFSELLATGSGLLSIGFGCFLAYQIGFIDGLLTSHPHWVPR